MITAYYFTLPEFAKIMDTSISTILFLIAENIIPIELINPSSSEVGQLVIQDMSVRQAEYIQSFIEIERAAL